MSKAQWTTKDGRKVEVAEMEDRHLVNAIWYMRRHAERIQWRDLAHLSRFAETLNGEHAIDAAESAMEELGEMEPEDYLETLPQYQALVKEATRRKLEHLIGDWDFND